MSPLGELAGLFTRLGLIGFGGPAAHVALMRDEVVHRRRWLTDEGFLDLVAAANLIPGPNSTELAMHVGWRRAGTRGLLVAGACFIAPAFLIVLAIATTYRRYGTTPEATWLLAGITPIVVAIIAQALWSFAQAAIKTVTAATFAVGAVVASMAGVHELIILACCAAAMLAWRQWRWQGLGALVLALAAIAIIITAGAHLGAPDIHETVSAPAATRPLTLGALGAFFAKVGSVLFGSGYVLVAFLRADLVERWGWLTTQQLLDAIAVGQFTPGPLFTTATFIGDLLLGVPGAAVATLGIFGPGFVFVALTAPFIERLRRSRVLSALLDGVVLASLGLMLAVTIFLARGALTTAPRALLAAAALLLLLWRRPNSAWLIVAGAAIGWLTRGL